MPPGLTPGRLNAVVELPARGQRGKHQRDSGEPHRFSHRLAAGRSGRRYPFRWRGPRSSRTPSRCCCEASSFRPQGYCLLDTATPLRLKDATVAFTGREIPRERSRTSCRRYLQKLTIFIPAAPSRTESEAAIRLTTAVVARYGKQQLDVDVAPIPARPSCAFGDRPVRSNVRSSYVKDAGGGVSLDSTVDVPTLFITGVAVTS